MASGWWAAGEGRDAEDEGEAICCAPPHPPKPAPLNPVPAPQAAEHAVAREEQLPLPPDSGRQRRGRCSAAGVCGGVVCMRGGEGEGAGKEWAGCTAYGRCITTVSLPACVMLI